MVREPNARESVVALGRGSGISLRRSPAEGASYYPSDEFTIGSRPVGLERETLALPETCGFPQLGGS